MRTKRTLVALAAMLAAGMAQGHGMIPRDAPAERLIKNLEAKLKDRPDDAESQYRLGRVHLLVLERKSGAIPVWDRRGDETDVPTEGSWSKRGGFGEEKKPAELKGQELATHLSEAIKHLNKAIALRPGEARYHLTLASVLEAGLTLREKVDEHPCPEVSGAAERKSEAAGWCGELAKKALAGDKESAAQVREMLTQYSWDAAGPSYRDLLISQLYSRRAGLEGFAFVREILELDWKQQILDHYFTAMCLSLPEDSKVKEQPIWGGMEDFTAYEAGGGFVRAAKALKLDGSNKMRMAVADAVVKGFDGLPRPNAITPIVLSMRASTGIPELTAPGSAAAFDLDGSGLARPWSWLKPETGLLCWDPAGEGKITSGWQLFGSVSWRLFFETGYEALEALDDNRDGKLTGAELKGLAVWFDRDGDGASDAGEVVRVEELGIAALSCVQDGTSAGCPMSSRGVEFADGRVLPTYDWIAEARPGSTGRTVPTYLWAAAAPGLWLVRRRLKSGATR